MKENIFSPFSVSMCVYEKDNPNWFKEAINSILNQTVLPQEIVLVVDGPVPKELDNIICEFETNKLFNVVRLKENQGHGIARRYGLEKCKNDIVALMDSDDICVHDRFEQQLSIINNQNIDIIGGDIAEFIDNPANIVGYRVLPCHDKELKEYAKSRCPFNQMTVMFKKRSVEKAGGYLDWYCNEDYYLWIRMIQHNFTMANTGTVLVNMRVGNDLYQRRGGWKYFKSEAKLQHYMLKNEMISIFRYFMNINKRLIVQVLLPNKMRSWVYQNFARKKRK